MDTLKPKMGFALLPPERRKEISSMGGKALKDEGRSFSINRELAREAGRKGGLAVPAERRTFSIDRNAAAAAGRKGGLKNRKTA